MTDERVARRRRADRRERASTTARPTTRAWSAPAGRRRLRRRRVGAGRGRAARRRAAWSRRPGRRCAAPAGLEPVAITTSPSGRTIVDFGQNLVGRLRLRVAGEAGPDDHAAPRRGARGRRAVHPAAAAGARHRRYTLRGGGAGDVGAALHLPRLPLRRGRRLAGRARRRATRAVVCHTDMERTGWFECSDPLRRPAARERRLGHARQLPRRARPIARSATSGSGWTGDIQVFAPTASFLYDCAACWLVAGRPGGRAGRTGHGAVSSRSSCASHRRWPRLTPPAAAWGDAAVIVPWVLYQRYGDAGLLAAQFDEHARLGRPRGRARPARPALWDTRLPVRRLARPGRAAGPARGRAATDPAPGRHRLPRPSRPSSLARGGGACSAATRTPRATPRSPTGVRAAFSREYVTPDGRWSATPRPAYALALAFGLLPDGRRSASAPGARLAELVAPRTATASRTGFVGTPLVCDALCDAGEHDAAYRLLHAARVPVVAVPGDDGRDDDLGALGQPAARTARSTRAR